MINLKDLTIDEKITLLTGKDCWRINDLNGKLPSLFVSDGPNGLRKIAPDGSTVKATAMPNISMLTNSWDTELAFLDGSTIAEDCIENDVDVLLAPGVNIKRTPLNGRNFEYFSEDPYLAGTMAKSYIEGVQSKGVGTSLKHFVANNREYDRLFQSNDIDERTIREIYCKPFEIAVQAKPWTVMCSYNLVNGVKVAEHRQLLKDILRDKLGFDGLIVSDWGAVENPVNSVKATLDLCMPYYGNYFTEIKSAYEKGEITEEEIDFAVTNILNLLEKKEKANKKVTLSKQERHDNAVKIAKESIVLLKNDDDILPLNKNSKVFVGGRFNNNPSLGGGGSAYVLTDYEVPSLSEVLDKNYVYTIKKGLSLAIGVHDDIKMSLEYVRNARADYNDILDNDICIICVGEEAPTVSENYDREHLKLSTAQEEFIIRASELNENVVVVLHAGSAIDVSNWIDCVKGVVLAGFGGEGINEALASVLSGETNPSGKLSETYPICLEDTYCEDYLGNKGVEWYRDGIFVGYRYYDKTRTEVAFPFGHGLSYAEFEYSNISVEKVSKYEYNLSYDIKNLSKGDGKEVSQVYIKEVLPWVTRPEKELKAFSKDLIKAGETKKINVKLDFNAFSYFSTPHDKFIVKDGYFDVMIGASSRDIKLITRIKIDN